MYWDGTNYKLIDWITDGQSKYVQNDKYQFNQEKQQILDEIQINLKFLQSLQNSERKSFKTEDMMEDTVLFNVQKSQTFQNEQSIEQYLKNVDENAKAIQIDVNDSVDELDCLAESQQQQDLQFQYDQEQETNYRSSIVPQLIQVEKEINNDLSHLQNANTNKCIKPQNRKDNKTFRSLIPKIQGVNLRSRSQNRSKSRFSQESSRIPKIAPNQFKKFSKIEKQETSIQKKIMSNRLNQIITIEIKPANNKTSSIKNDKMQKQLQKKKDIFQSFDEQGFNLQDKKIVCKDQAKKGVEIQKRKKSFTQSKNESPIKDTSPKKKVIKTKPNSPSKKQLESQNKENPEQNCMSLIKIESPSKLSNMETQKSIQIFDSKKQITKEQAEELCNQALRDSSNLQNNNGFYIFNQLNQSDIQNEQSECSLEFMKLIELNKRKQEISRMDKNSKAQLKNAISQLMKELDETE